VNERNRKRKKEARGWVEGVGRRVPITASTLIAGCIAPGHIEGFNVVETRQRKCMRTYISADGVGKCGAGDAQQCIVINVDLVVSHRRYHLTIPV